MTTFSGLIKRTTPHRNKYSGRNGHKVTRVIPHHWAGLGGGEEHLTNPNVQASANYLILNNGDIVGQVPEEFRAWTTGGQSIDQNAITFEIQNSSGRVNNNDSDPNSWKISDAAWNSLIRLIADVAKRHNWSSIGPDSVRFHREFSQTSCPGGYVWSRRDLIREQAQALFSGANPPAPTNPSTPPPTSDKSVAQLAQEVIDGKHGNGEARKKSLGNQYSAVQAEVNRRLLGTSTPAPSTPSAPAAKTVAQLAQEVIDGKHGNGEARKKSLGNQYAAVQAEVNRRLLGTSSRPAPTTAPAPAPTPTKTVAQLAQEVIDGKHGSGEARMKSLGSRYTAVQAEVNRRLRIAGKQSVSSGKTVAQLAQEVIDGKHGDGEARKKSLGGQYAVVQAEVNRRLLGR